MQNLKRFALLFLQFCDSSREFMVLVLVLILNVFNYNTGFFTCAVIKSSSQSAWLALDHTSVRLKPHRWHELKHKYFFIIGKNNLIFTSPLLQEISPRTTDKTDDSMSRIYGSKIPKRILKRCSLSFPNALLIKQPLLAFPLHVCKI